MRSFGHNRPIRDDKGAIVGSTPSPVQVRTIEPLGPFFGTDKEKRLIVTLDAKDLIVMRPEKTQRAVSVKAADVYAWVLRTQANFIARAKAEARKVVKDARRDAARIRATDRAISRKAKQYK